MLENSKGILLVLVRKPYDVGDRIVIQEPNAAVDNMGPPSGGWVVEKVDLYSTTVRLGTTREYCTFSNGSLANSRILNLNRSDKPNVFHYLKFAMNVSQDQLDIFRREVNQYVKDRPRSWIKVVSMRCKAIEIDLQYLQYALIIQHREKWQSFSAIQVDKGEVFTFCLNLMKRLNMNYTAPKMPIELVPSTGPNPSGYIDDARRKVAETYGPNAVDLDQDIPYSSKNKNV
jgi:Mechanosensitive ion channel